MMIKISKSSFLAFTTVGFTSIALLSVGSIQSALAAPPKASVASPAKSAPTMSGVKQPLTKVPVLKIGSKGQAVKELQTLLKAAGVYQGTADGVFGKQTQTAVIQFQQSKPLKADGVVGTKTWAALHG